MKKVVTAFRHDKQSIAGQVSQGKPRLKGYVWVDGKRVSATKAGKGAY